MDEGCRGLLTCSVPQPPSFGNYCGAPWRTGPGRRAWSQARRCAPPTGLRRQTVADRAMQASTQGPALVALTRKADRHAALTHHALCRTGTAMLHLLTDRWGGA